ncbi:GNAT family N-acetyltransferase [Paenisporosarcina sp. NPDC076898]|uniref:GNAT family N-acetyltransferase n=1 Tax=unclassified Paenisporosarcina TaxID=2642018 RepID=UPI003D05277A
MRIRTETKNDFKHVFNLNYTTFGNRDDEAKLVEQIRFSDGFIPKLSIVAEDQGDIVGHLLLSKAKLTNEGKDKVVIVLAPVAVLPKFQKKGIGSKLIEEGLKRAKKEGYGLVFLIGHPDYYPKFGFQPARAHGLELTQFQVPDDVFMVCELIDGELENNVGELHYPKAFFGTATQK